MYTVNSGRYRFISFTDAGRDLMEQLYSIMDHNSEIGSLSKEEQPCKMEQNLDSSEQEKSYKHEQTSCSTPRSLSDWTCDNFKKGNVLVFIGAIGIAVRAIAPFIKDKTTDPAVIVIDEKGRFVIPVLSGHLGGAVDAARRLAGMIGATPVLTTATDVRDEFAIDVFASSNNMAINDMHKAKEFTAKILAGSSAQFTVTPNLKKDGGMYLIPKMLVIGMGCRRGKSFEELQAFLQDILAINNYDIRAIKVLVSVDKKKDEEGLIKLSKYLDIPFVTFTPEVLMEQEGDFDHSDMVMQTIGADNVCERAVYAYGCRELTLKKTARDGMTIAIGLTDVEIKV